MQLIIFYAHIHACSFSYTGEELFRNLWLVDHSYDRAIKTVCCL